MSYAENLSLFSVLLFGIIIVPGMDMLLVLTNALTNGRRAGLAATAGIIAGGLVHTLWGALSVGALLALPAAVFTTMIYTGAVFMAWIGWSLLRSSIAVKVIERAEQQSTAGAFIQGLTTCLLNPKAYLFMAAVFPQFVKPQFGPIWSQALVMGAMTSIMQLGIYGGLALCAAQSSAWLTSSGRATTLIGRGAGLLFLAMAALALLQASNLER